MLRPHHMLCVLALLQPTHAFVHTIGVSRRTSPGLALSTGMPPQYESHSHCQAVAMSAAGPAASSAFKIITSPLVFGLNVAGMGLKFAWRLAVLAVVAWFVQRALLVPRLRVKVSGAISSALKFLAMAGQGVSMAAAAWHARNVQIVAELDQVESQKRQAATAPESQAAEWTAAPAEPPVAAKAAASGSSAQSEEDIRSEVQRMRVRAIKEELTALGVAHADAVEKEELVVRLVNARLKGGASAAPPPPPAPPSPPPTPPPEVITDNPAGGVGGGANPFANANPFASPFGGGGGGAGFPDSVEDFDAFASQLGVDPKEAMAQAEAMAANPEAMGMMERMQQNPRVMEAVMDIAMNGEQAAKKYENDAEVLAMVREMEKLSGQFPGMF